VLVILEMLAGERPVSCAKVLFVNPGRVPLNASSTFKPLATLVAYRGSDQAVGRAIERIKRM
jgi:hypothetical protein